MVTIELSAKCDRCEAAVEQKMDYQTTSIASAAGLLKRLRNKGWEFHYDQKWALILTLCPICAKGEKR